MTGDPDKVPPARTRVVLISHELPNDDPGHAGGVYVQHVHRFAAANAHVTAISPNTPSNREARESPGSPERTLLPHFPGPGRRVTRYADALMLRIFQTTGRVCIGLPSFSVTRALSGRTAERKAVAEADIIDLQYSESIRLAALIRRINPNARIVGTFHDVQSQVVARHPARVGQGWVAWRINAWQLARAERNAFQRLDDVVVFSDKDAALLPGHCRVIRPPLAKPLEVRHDYPEATRAPVVLMVGVLTRPENDAGARWLVEQVWPRVREQVPSALLRIAGSGASSALVACVQGQAGAALLGYVDDLEHEYAAASVVAVPLHSGAGVKFKTIEALVRGIPVVATPVGAEGIGTAHHYGGLADDSVAFADAVVAVLLDSSQAEARARATAEWAATEFGPAQFHAETQASYAVRGWSSTETGAGPHRRTP